METLQEDLLSIYNNLVMFSDNTVGTNFPKPIKVFYEIDSRMLVLEQLGKSCRMSLPNYYCWDLEKIQKPTYLLPEDYDFLMANLQQLINSGKLLDSRTCVSPSPYGFDVYAVNRSEMFKGPDLIGSIKFISGRSYLFKLITKLRFRL